MLIGAALGLPISASSLAAIMTAKVREQHSQAPAAQEAGQARLELPDSRAAGGDRGRSVQPVARTLRVNAAGRPDGSERGLRPVRGLGRAQRPAGAPLLVFGRRMSEAVTRLGGHCLHSNGRYYEGIAIADAGSSAPLTGF